uniref:Uncharacterized protein n=1 Tax=Arundo donax TaxID=35708 RepID=A0A0A9H8K7_ARUDO
MMTLQKKLQLLTIPAESVRLSCGNLIFSPFFIRMV